MTELKSTATALKEQQRKLLQLHYQDALPADLLKEEQGRIGKELAGVQHELDAATSDHDDVLTNLSDALTLAEDCDQMYKSVPDHIKRQLNQVFYTVVHINPNDHGGSAPTVNSRSPSARSSTPPYVTPQELTSPHAAVQTQTSPPRRAGLFNQDLYNTGRRTLPTLLMSAVLLRY
ncbi:hypothetical protein HF995_11920 [Sanguibacter hominis ATCC BAA-789]|uniref:Uncharacterized protein n=1 Tax=Sanguibacter hominis ATCC BAA-789 TaxID=1312740 RepID=A0A9X5IT75_9MICO|nr:hypothetical protein [Sanguibacter hominis ATCC BAA-789]